MRQTLEQRVFMYDNYVESRSAGKVRKISRFTFQDVTVPHAETVCRIANILRRTGLLLYIKIE